uniref:Uncharacterized protein n=1 Tax=Chromera velia CCMP2878 TaxID=1169474 RepID=A0A0G4HE72_9ALVE|eukprot:Cvel_26688.t1-p1 / transcript=Cvel_26688.t1 / gene=Cvel_26688 / organism=Chromera_velia_CCMP2878 / gene_product=Proline-rich receptor-like protein kinase PERK9, putative / transcript_product=Proline-rich receptor-like protein kinase PERK9, putative / location=Cvel_scaffold3215:5186-8323(+) / protein_length=593 / sequence_SO=supercontig / SO=protein_coding / is_pseudo=false
MGSPSAKMGWRPGLLEEAAGVSRDLASLLCDSDRTVAVVFADCLPDSLCNSIALDALRRLVVSRAQSGRDGKETGEAARGVFIAHEESLRENPPRELGGPSRDGSGTVDGPAGGREGGEEDSEEDSDDELQLRTLDPPLTSRPTMPSSLSKGTHTDLSPRADMSRVLLKFVEAPSSLLEVLAGLHRLLPFCSPPGGVGMHGGRDGGEGSPGGSTQASPFSAYASPAAAATPMTAATAHPGPPIPPQGCEGTLSPALSVVGLHHLELWLEGLCRPPVSSEGGGGREGDEGRDSSRRTDKMRVRALLVSLFLSSFTARRKRFGREGGEGEKKGAEDEVEDCQGSESHCGDRPVPLRVLFERAALDLQSEDPLTIKGLNKLLLPQQEPDERDGDGDKSVEFAQTRDSGGPLSPAVHPSRGGSSALPASAFASRHPVQPPSSLRGSRGLPLPPSSSSFCADSGLLTPGEGSGNGQEGWGAGRISVSSTTADGCPSTGGGRKSRPSLFHRGKGSLRGGLGGGPRSALAGLAEFYRQRVDRVILVLPLEREEGKGEGHRLCVGGVSGFGTIAQRGGGSVVSAVDVSDIVFSAGPKLNGD